MKTKTEAVTFPTKEQPFTHFELGLDPVEQECLADFHINHAASLNGILVDFEQSLDQVKRFICSVGENDSVACSQLVEIIFKIAHKVLDIFQQESAYIMLRTFIPNDEFKTPRWHQDGYYYTPRSGMPLKAAIPLKGAGTLFYKALPSELASFKKLESNREEVANILGEISRKECTPPHHGSLFIVGSSAGAIHSEPYIGSQRFFMSVLPGTKKQIAEWDSQIKLTDKLQEEGKSIEEIIQAVSEHIRFHEEEASQNQNRRC